MPRAQSSDEEWNPDEELEEEDAEEPVRAPTEVSTLAELSGVRQDSACHSLVCMLTYRYTRSVCTVPPPTEATHANTTADA